MIGSLRGTVESLNGSCALISVGGVGYEVTVTERLLERLALGEETFMVIFTHVAEDILRLYGFNDTLEKQVFLLLTKVKGVGPKSAAEIVSGIECRELLRIVAAGDVARLQAVRGVGRKTAERIVLELKDKVGSYVVEQHSALASQIEREMSPVEDAVQALQALGFIRKDAERALQSALQSGVAPSAEPGTLVKEALRFV